MGAVRNIPEKKSKIKWILIDIGDVLLIKNNAWTNFSQLLADELNVDLELAQKINKAHFSTMDIKYISESDFIDSLKINFGYDAPSDIFSYFSRAYEKQASPNESLFIFLKQLRADGIKTAILSNTIAIYQQNHEQLGISEKDGFNPILYSWREEMKKPDERFFTLAMEKMGAKPDETIFIDDKLKNIRMANRIGMNGILFDIGHTDRAIERILRIIKNKNGKAKK